MKVWECLVCGWLYDEAKGWPEDGIAPGTAWQDVPEDWLCPECGVGKEDFEMVEVAASDNAAIDVADEKTSEETGKETSEEASPVQADVADSSAINHPVIDLPVVIDPPVVIDLPIVIIGTGLAGYNLAREFRKLDKETPLLLITTDDGCCYSKPMLSTGFTREMTADDLSQANAGQMAEQLQASIWTFTEVTSINTDEQTLEVDSSKTTPYKALVLAWGAEVIHPPLTGTGLDSVYAINDLLDYRRLRETITDTNAKKVFVIGAGLIGSEITNDLLNGGFHVEAVDPLAHNLASLLPEPAGRAVQQALEEQGAKFHFGTTAESINAQASGKGVLLTLANGLEVTADLVISAIGVRPRIKLAQQSGIAVNRGIKANRLMATSAANVYTLGDCAEVEGHVLYYVAPLMAAARALAKTLTGTPTNVEYPAMPVTIKTPACPIVVAPPARQAEGSWEIQIDSADNKNVIAQFKNANGQLLGFALTGQGTKEKQALQKQLPAILA